MFFIGNTKSFKVKVRPAENFPVDIYFLNDLSNSMKPDLKNLQKLANDIGMIFSHSHCLKYLFEKCHFIRFRFELDFSYLAY